MNRPHSIPLSVERWNPLLGERVIMAPMTAVRPWNGKVIPTVENGQSEFDPSCYLCPGVQRSAGAFNPPYRDVFVFDNDFATFVMQEDVDARKRESDETPAQGVCRVVCFSPKHNVTLAEMSEPNIQKVLQTLCAQFQELSALPEIEYIMLFENKGELIGVSNPHPHGQIYATDFIPRIPATMYNNAREFMDNQGKCLFCDILKREEQANIRIVCQNKHFIAYVPYFARFKYEVHIISRRHISYMTELEPEEMASLTSIYREMLIRYDNLFQMPFPNITIFYNAPCKQGLDPSPWHFHIQFCPPLRSADKLKYMAGFETGGGNVINPSLPRDSATALRDVSNTHYSLSCLPTEKPD